MALFDKILIANRGEIALRIMRTCKRMGIKTVAVYSEIDAKSLHVQEAEEAVLLGGPRAQDSYLAAEKIVEAALRCGCQAIHPGYGFLSQSPRFARMVADAGLVFIGPDASTLTLLGDKVGAKTLAVRVGIPAIPGCDRPLASLQEVSACAKEIGYPILLKPAAGGGGKGMHLVFSEDKLEQILSTSREEARKAFGDDSVFLERFIPEPRHVEIQVLADRHGNVIHLGERECSIQRRFQKIIEEAPSAAVGEIQRRKMGQMACNLLREAGYAGAGTVEFIFDRDANFYFMEVNPRLQVEHPVTEMVTSTDIVELQIRIAAGEPLPIKQEDVSMKGWAVEARICAEDPTRDFLPSTGLITRYAMPHGANVRVDSGVNIGSIVSIYYDSLLAKVIAWGETRAEAIETLVQALNACQIEGPVTNLEFVNAILNHPAFLRGDLSTAFIETHCEGGRVKTKPSAEHLAFMAMAATLVYHNRQAVTFESLSPMATRLETPPNQKGEDHYVVRGGDDIFNVTLQGDRGSGKWVVRVNETEYSVLTPPFQFYQRRLKLTINGKVQFFSLQAREDFIGVAFRGITRTFEVYTPREWRFLGYMPVLREEEKENVVRCPMPGLVVAVHVKKGDRVYRGEGLVTVETMKMESLIPSPWEGEVEEVLVQPGGAVETGDLLVRFKA